ncbi:50S ribosomal protein L24 [Candidatus Bathyarchaeota archaeon]|nr:50S ribosomal protein L24 [Candidatus Bathyarchaeota archaeon]MBS7613917.1 50S ribosomal protein L24 [Candidatus Bathyarchaeota archaeon]MBS7618389.1 50S ribosomal protein L24 [Candidatus Bathyarchaeota archaeon]
MSKQPRKQRRAFFDAPKHVIVKILSAHLSDELKEKYKRRSFPIRKGDTVKIVRGDFKGFSGAVLRVDRERMRIYVEGVTREKVDGTKVLIPIRSSKVIITKINLDDKRRVKALERKIKIQTPEMMKT